MMVKLPSDIGFRDDGFALPPLSVAPAWVEDNSQAIAQAEGRLFYQGLHGVTGRAAARRSAVPAKVDRAAAILQASGEQWVVWCGLNDEAAELTKRVTGAVNVQGSDSLDRKARCDCGVPSWRDSCTRDQATYCGLRPQPATLPSDDVRRVVR